MPRQNKPWFRKDTGWWMVTLGGKKTRLVEGRKNRSLAVQKFHELKATTPQAPDSATGIGQFGIGLLSAFIVADSVTVTTRKVGSGLSEAGYGRADGAWHEVSLLRLPRGACGNFTSLCNRRTGAFSTSALRPAGRRLGTPSRAGLTIRSQAGSYPVV